MFACFAMFLIFRIDDFFVVVMKRKINYMKKKKTFKNKFLNKIERIKRMKKALIE